MGQAVIMLTSAEPESVGPNTKPPKMPPMYQNLFNILANGRRVNV